MKPIIFSTNGVKALLNTKPGTWPAEPINSSRQCKSQTRQVLKPRYRHKNGETGFEVSTGVKHGGRYVHIIDEHGSITRDYRPPYNIGDKLWVRESHVFTNHGNPVYKADFRDNRGDYWASVASDPKGVKWRPSIHMPREAARLFLEVREIRVERLQDISLKDIEAEGFYCEDSTGSWSDFKDKNFVFHDTYAPGMRIHFAKFWNAINGKGAWKSNPWVFVYGFMRVGV